MLNQVHTLYFFVSSFDHFLSCRDQRRTILKCSLIEFNYVSYDFKLYVAWSDAIKTNIKINSTYKGDTDLLADATLESLKTNRSMKWIISERLLQKIYKFRLCVCVFFLSIKITGVAISNLRAKMANVSRKICAVMVTLHVKMNQTKTIVNALPACLPVRGGNAFRQQMCATEKTTALTEMTKTIAVST